MDRDRQIVQQTVAHHVGNTGESIQSTVLRGSDNADIDEYYGFSVGRLRGGKGCFVFSLFALGRASVIIAGG